MLLDTAASRVVTVAESLLHITPVDPQFLAQHKVAQIAKHGPSWAYRHRHALNALAPFMAIFPAAFLLVGGIVAVVEAHEPIYAMGFPLGCLWFYATARWALDQKFRGPAYWTEHYLGGADVLPAEVAALVARVKEFHPHAPFVVGELRNQYVTLDPYLTVYIGNRIECLAIWDGDTIIARAEITE